MVLMVPSVSWIALVPKVHSRSVDPRKLCVGVKYYVVRSCIHQNDILQVAVPNGMRARKGRAKSTGHSSFAAATSAFVLG